VLGYTTIITAAWEAEVRRSRVPGWPGLHSETESQNQKKKEKEEEKKKERKRERKEEKNSTWEYGKHTIGQDMLWFECIPPKFMCWKLIPNVAVLRRGTCETILSSRMDWSIHG
jgi:hypothetical protein